MPDYLTPEAIASGIALTLFSFLALVGKRAGQQEERQAKNGGRMEIAGALVDGRDARAIVEALERNTKALGHNSDMAHNAARAAADVSTEARRLADEIIRNGRAS